MKVEFDNRSVIPDATVREVVDFMAARYQDVGKTVKVTILDRPRHYGVWGKAYWPLQKGGLRKGSRTRKWGFHSVRLFVGRLPWPDGYPYSFEYKKLAGPATYHNLLESFIHLLAHELRHIEQFHQVEVCYPKWRATSIFKAVYKKWQKMLPYASGEVDAERHAHTVLDAWRTRGIVPESAVNQPERETM